MTGTLNFGSGTHIFDDGASHIEADGTLWLNGNTSSDVRIGGNIYSAKRMTLNGLDALNGHLAVIGGTNAARILTTGSAAVIQGMNTALSTMAPIWMMGTQVYLQNDNGNTNLNLTDSGVAIKNAVTISQNAAALTNSNGLYVVAANTQPGSVMVDGFGSGGFTQFLGRAARGTAAARTAVQTGDWLTLIRGQGAVDATNYSEACRLTFLARENWTPTATGGYMQLLTVAPGTTTQEIPVTVGRGLIVGGSIANDPGPGSIYAANIIQAKGYIEVNATPDAILRLSGPRVYSIYARNDQSFAILDNTRVAWLMQANTVGEVDLYNNLTLNSSGSFRFDASNQHYIGCDRNGQITIGTGGVVLWYLRRSDNLVFNNVGTVAGNGAYINLACFADLKQDIRPIPDPIGLIESLKPVAFNYKDSGESMHGFIVEDMETLYPETIQYHPDTHEATGIRESVVIAGLTAAVQELAARVKALEGATP